MENNGQFTFTNGHGLGVGMVEFGYTVLAFVIYPRKYGKVLYFFAKLGRVSFGKVGCVLLGRKNGQPVEISYNFVAILKRVPFHGDALRPLQTYSRIHHPTDT